VTVTRPSRLAVLAVLAALVTATCGEDEPTTGQRGATVRIRPGTDSIAAMEQAKKQQTDFYASAARTKGNDESAEVALIEHKITEDSFIESPGHRDPFRSFIVPLTAKSEASAQPQVEALLTEYQIEELKLIAIISGAGTESGAPLAMVVDPTGLGHIIRRGNFVGRGETVRKVHSGEEVFIYWRVARIREDAVVFEREDPFSPTEATVTKILMLEGGD
jgi:Tfp pilus assembly protein PilP